jgi:hypothetical protein
MSRSHQAGLALLVGVGFVFAGMAGDAAAAPQTSFTLTDDNSVATFDLASDAGMSGWTVDGVNHMARQWFWYRAGTTGPESSIDNLALSLSGAVDSNFDGQDDVLFARYTGTGFTLEVRLSLDGGASGTRYSTVAEQVTIKNNSLTSNLDFHLFQYTDFNLGNTPNDDGIAIVAILPDTIYQTDPTYDGDTVVVPKANYFDAGLAATLLAALNDGATTTLGDTFLAGPGSDVAWALQWDATIKPNKTYQVVIGKTITPEPATVALLTLGGLALALRRRR